MSSHPVLATILSDNYYLLLVYVIATVIPKMKRTRVVVAAVPLVVFAAVSLLAYGLSVSFRLPTPFNES